MAEMSEAIKYLGNHVEMTLNIGGKLVTRKGIVNKLCDSYDIILDYDEVYDGYKSVNLLSGIVEIVSVEILDDDKEIKFKNHMEVTLRDGLKGVVWNGFIFVDDSTTIGIDGYDGYKYKFDKINDIVYATLDGEVVYEEFDINNLNNGDLIEVSRSKTEWYERKFACILNDKVYCYAWNDDTKLFAWDEVRPIKK